MNRDILLYRLCPMSRVYDCCIADGDYDCDNCKRLTKEWFNEYDKQIRTDAIDGFANWLVEQGILGNRCISDGEITDYGKVYAKKYKEQFKEGGKNESRRIS